MVRCSRATLPAGRTNHRTCMQGGMPPNSHNCGLCISKELQLPDSLSSRWKARPVKQPNCFEQANGKQPLERNSTLVKFGDDLDPIHKGGQVVAAASQVRKLSTDCENIVGVLYFESDREDRSRCECNTLERISGAVTQIRLGRTMARRLWTFGSSERALDSIIDKAIGEQTASIENLLTSLMVEFDTRGKCVGKVRVIEVEISRCALAVGRFTDSRIDTQERGFCPSFPDRFCSCRSAAVVHLKGTSEKRVGRKWVSGMVETHTGLSWPSGFADTRFYQERDKCDLMCLPCTHGEAEAKSDYLLKNKERIFGGEVEVGSEVLNDLENLRTRVHQMENEISALRTVQSIACLLNLEATCDPTISEKASIFIDTMASEICQRIERRHQVLISNAPDRIPLKHTKTAILTACGMQDTICTARRLPEVETVHVLPNYNEIPG
ncbi:hypothetical protein CLF_112777 [Clonorchis sinensis]|uniref:Uncharacterized protein n=1 Tax=Clonorchis sinensis TaxID=79923 RepID=G7YMP7_CLOSI|nr:hypothetical protein CLF_112777 [Clonorchis sinensis]